MTAYQKENPSIKLVAYSEILCIIRLYPTLCIDNINVTTTTFLDFASFSIRKDNKKERHSVEHIPPTKQALMSQIFYC